jgi:hypothetical protein
MAESEATETDIFQQQKKTIDTLIDVLAKQGTGQPQIIYTQPAAEEPKQAAPNYILYIVLGIVAIILIFKIKK